MCTKISPLGGGKRFENRGIPLSTLFGKRRDVIYYSRKTLTEGRKLF